MTERLLTVRDVSILLGISEKEVMDLVENKRLEAYKVGGVYVRFKEDQITQFKKTFKTAAENAPPHQYSLKDRLNDFFYFNDFYIFSILIIVLILIIIFQGY